MKHTSLKRHVQLRAKKRDSLQRRNRIRQVIRTLEAKGVKFPKFVAVRKEAVKVLGDGREVCRDNESGRLEYARRRNQMYERQNGICVICGKWMRPDESTFEHQDGRNPVYRDERIVKDGKPYNGAAHGLCNTEKGSRRIPYLYQVKPEGSRRDYVPTGAGA